MSKEHINLFWLKNCHNLESMVTIYLDPNINPKRRKHADKFILNFLTLFAGSMQSSHHLNVPNRPNRFWVSFKKAIFIFLVCCGIIHAVSAAFDGVNAVLTTLGFSTMFVSVACVVLGVFGILLFFSYELTKLARAFDLDDTIQIPSRAKEVCRMQKQVMLIRGKLEDLMRDSLTSHDLVSYKFYNRLYLDFIKTLKPLRDQIEAWQAVREGWGRKILKAVLATLAGMLAGSVAYFDGFTMMSVLARLFQVTLPAALTLWLPILIGVLCFVVLLTIGIINEGANLIHLIDEIRGQPYDVIFQILDTRLWEISNYENILMQKAIVDRAELKPKLLFMTGSIKSRMIRSDDELIFEYEENYNSMAVRHEGVATLGP